ncbi:MAG: hypothetical protein KTR31_14730 [Myxococcales bacterium]|nr:hypothetical protein [Myxococcales bacterium]
MVWSFVLSLAAAAEPSEVDWTITVDPLTVALGFPHVQVERALSDRTSLYVGPHARLFDGILTEGREPFVGVGGEVGFRYFPWGRAPQGGWVMARQVVAVLSTTDGTDRTELGGYSSVLVGGTGLLGGVFVLSGGAGVQYLYYDIDGYGSSGPFVALHTNLGFAF